MNIAFQLMCHETGVRSEPASTTRAQLANALKTYPGSGKDFVLVIMEQRGDDWTVSSAPLLTIDSFREQFTNHVEVINDAT